MKVLLKRFWSDDKQSTATLLVLDEKGQPVYSQVSIERGDLNNKKNESRVPAGTYPLVLEMSPKFGYKLWELKKVPNRAECKIHPSNFWHQLNGCIAPGIGLKKIDKDGYYDVYESRKATLEFHKALEGLEKTTITIIDEE